MSAFGQLSTRTMRLAGFTFPQITRLVLLKHHIAQGIVHEDTTDRRRLKFGRWLWMSGRLGEGP